MLLGDYYTLNKQKSIYAILFVATMEYMHNLYIYVQLFRIERYWFIGFLPLKCRVPLLLTARAGLGQIGTKGRWNCAISMSSLGCYEIVTERCLLQFSCVNSNYFAPSEELS